MAIKKRALAIAAHPDDIEFMMAGTLLLLANAGYEIHYMNVANGSCGTDRLDKDEIIRIRRSEAFAAAAYVGAVFHESLCDDICIFYEKNLLARLASVIREVNPEIILTHNYNEYMEDHSNTCRLTVSAVFCRGMRNFPVDPPIPPVSRKVSIYRSLPYGLYDNMHCLVTPEFYVNITTVMEKKSEMLALHKSQKEWLDVSQGMNSYLNAMREMCAQAGKMTGQFAFAEGWTRHLARGYCDPDDNPLSDALGIRIFSNPDFKRQASLDLMPG